ncbi:hypothetical protein [Acidovorax sp.]|uniref:hypothetical protein n=1 Tax=Acidovorax sp. TaxID=1872122 RepID=UPI00391F2DAF
MHALPLRRLSRAIAVLVTLTAGTVQAQPCQQPGAAGTWKWALGSDVAQLTYGDHENGKPLFSLERSPSQEAMRMVLHVDMALLPKDQKVPAYMPFSFEAGFHTGRDADIRAVDGIGFLYALQGGGHAVIAGSLRHPESNLKGYRQVLAASRQSFRFHADALCYEIPLPAEPRKVMAALLAPQASFSKQVPRLFAR